MGILHFILNNRRNIILVVHRSLLWNIKVECLFITVLSGSCSRPLFFPLSNTVLNRGLLIVNVFLQHNFRRLEILRD
jgi:hypothetical protein